MDIHTENPDWFVPNLEGNIIVSQEATSLEGAPEVVHGCFDCTDCEELVSLQGGPREVHGDFYCSYTEIKSLEEAPEKVHGYFSCGSTQITSLEGAPREVHGYFNCTDTQITSLEGSPREVGGTFNCSHCKELVSLRGAPRKTNGFDCSSTQITSLEGSPQEVHGYFDCSDTDITDPYEYRYALTCKIGGEFISGNDEVNEIINAHHWGHGDKKLVMQGMKLLKDLSNKSA